MLPGALRPATAKAAADSGWPDDPGELRKSRKRTAELACVADIPPVPCTAEDILTALFGTSSHAVGSDGTARQQGPKAQGKTLFASAHKSIPAVIRDAFAEAHCRDPGHARPLFAVVDGNNTQIDTINALAAKYQVKVPILIDFIHVEQYLWKAAATFFRRLSCTRQLPAHFCPRG